MPAILALAVGVLLPGAALAAQQAPLPAPVAASLARAGAARSFEIVVVTTMAVTPSTTVRNVETVRVVQDRGTRAAYAVSVTHVPHAPEMRVEAYVNARVDCSRTPPAPWQCARLHGLGAYDALVLPEGTLTGARPLGLRRVDGVESAGWQGAVSFEGRGSAAGQGVSVSAGMSIHAPARVWVAVRTGLPVALIVDLPGVLVITCLYTDWNDPRVTVPPEP